MFSAAVLLITFTCFTIVLGVSPSFFFPNSVACVLFLSKKKVLSTGLSPGLCDWTSFRKILLLKIWISQLLKYWRLGCRLGCHLKESVFEELGMRLNYITIAWTYTNCGRQMGTYSKSFRSMFFSLSISLSSIAFIAEAGYSCRYHLGWMGSSRSEAMVVWAHAEEFKYLGILIISDGKMELR